MADHLFLLLQREFAASMGLIPLAMAGSPDAAKAFFRSKERFDELVRQWRAVGGTPGGAA